MSLMVLMAGNQWSLCSAAHWGMCLKKQNYLGVSWKFLTWYVWCIVYPPICLSLEKKFQLCNHILIFFFLFHYVNICEKLFSESVEPLNLFGMNASNLMWQIHNIYRFYIHTFCIITFCCISVLWHHCFSIDMHCFFIHEFTNGWCSHRLQLGMQT